jgi:hypothetical protein
MLWLPSALAICTLDAACEKITVSRTCALRQGSDGKLGRGIPEPEQLNLLMAFMRLAKRSSNIDRCTRSDSEWARRLGGVTAVAFTLLASQGTCQWGCHAHVSIIAEARARSTHHKSGACVPMIRPPRFGGVPRAFTAICLSNASTDAVFRKSLSFAR